jgi:hypothetical protein
MRKRDVFHPVCGLCKLIPDSDLSPGGTWLIGSRTFCGARLAAVRYYYCKEHLGGLTPIFGCKFSSLQRQFP